MFFVNISFLREVSKTFAFINQITLEAFSCATMFSSTKKLNRHSGSIVGSYLCFCGSRKSAAHKFRFHCYVMGICASLCFVLYVCLISERSPKSLNFHNVIAWNVEFLWLDLKRCYRLFASRSRARFPSLLNLAAENHMALSMYENDRNNRKILS